MIDDGSQNRIVSNDENEERLSAGEIISLMDIYEREWEYRDELLWKQVYRLFYFSLVMILLPSISAGIGIELPLINPKFFTVAGLFLASISILISWSYAVRLECSSETYMKLMSKLPESYRRISIDELYKTKRKMILKHPFKKDKSIFKMVQTRVIVTIFFLAEIIMAILILFFS